MNDKLKKIADMLFDLGAIKFGAFKLKLHEKNPDAPLSPIYLNLRTPVNPKPGPLTPEVVNLIAEYFFEMAQELGLDFDCVVGVPNAGDPFAAAFADFSDKPLLLLHKTEGADKRAVTSITDDSEYYVGDVALVVDDLITKADSKFETINVLENATLEVTDVLVLVDREQGGAAELENCNYHLHAAFTLTELLNYYVDTGRITAAKRDEVVAYLKAN